MPALLLATSYSLDVEQAVATSTVYLIRSMGTIYGVTLTSAVVQNTLLSRLPAALGPIEGLDEVRAMVLSFLTSTS